MRAAMVVLVLPAPKSGAKLGRGAERHPSVELLFVRAVTALHLAVHLGTARRNPTVGDSEIPEVPGEVGAKLVAVVSLHPLNGHREPLTDLVEKGDRIRNRAMGIDPEDTI